MEPSERQHKTGNVHEEILLERGLHLQYLKMLNNDEREI